MSEVLLVRSKRGNEAIIVDHYKYTRSKNLSSKDIIWMCPKKTCYASIKTNNKLVISELRGKHQHESLTLYEVHKLKIDSDLKTKAVVHPTVRPNKLIREAIATSGEDVTAKDKNNLRRHIYRQRRKEASASAAAAARQLAARQTRVLTPGRAERFVYVEEPADDGGADRPPVVAVTCATNLRLLCGFLTLYADTAPRRCRAAHFDRTYVVHAYKNGLYVPLAYLLLPADGGEDERGGGRLERYARAWRFLAELCRSHGLVFIPGSIRVDVDADARDAVRSVFPGCRVLACRFHVVRAWRAAVRPADGRGADDDCRRRRRHHRAAAETARWTRAFAGLSFLPAAEVSDAFCELVAVAPAGRRAIAYSDHVLDNYVDRDAPWPPSAWAEAPTDPARAAVGPERFRRRCGRQLADTANPPSVHKLVEFFKKTQVQTYIEIDNILHPTERHADLCFEEMKRLKFVEENYSRYVNGEISRLQYVITMGCEFDSCFGEDPDE